jgi:non-specific serine/threonine protein kinase
LSLAEQALPDLYSAEQVVWLVRLEREQGNVRAALRWAQEAGEAEVGLRLATALVPFWEAHGHLSEGRRWLQAALAVPADADAPALRMRALVGAGRLTHLHAAYAEAERLHAESLALARESNDLHGTATALIEMGMVMRRRRDHVRSIAYIEEGLALHRALGDEAGIAWALLNLGSTLGDLGELPGAIKHLTDSLERYAALGDLRHTATAQSLLGGALLNIGELERATQLLTASLAVHARLGGRWFVTYNLMFLVRIQVAIGQWETAARLLGAAQAIGDRVSSRISTVSYEELGATIREHLSPQRFSTAWTQGQALSFDQAVAAALTLAAPAIPATPAATDQEVGAQVHATPEPLTRREREVAALVAEGYTDRQIADALFISVGTVGVHVHRILGKLGLYSRVQVAEWLDDTSSTAGAVD